MVAAKNGRLNYAAGSSWCASSSDSSPYLQVDLGSVYMICAVASQGNSQADQWVKTYQVQYSTNGSNWVIYQEKGQKRVSQKQKYSKKYYLGTIIPTNPNKTSKGVCNSWLNITSAKEKHRIAYRKNIASKLDLD